MPGYGFLLNNELTDFNLDHGTAERARRAPNQLAGGKRPRSSIAPTIVLRNGRPFLALGSPGGATIITTVLQILVNRLDFGMTLPDAVAAPRASASATAATTQTEPASSTHGRRAAAARGQTFSVHTGRRPRSARRPGSSSCRTGQVLAAAEPARRGGGSAAVVVAATAHGHGGRHRMRPPHDVKRPGARR